MWVLVGSIKHKYLRTLVKAVKSFVVSSGLVVSSSNMCVFIGSRCASWNTRSWFIVWSVIWTESNTSNWIFIRCINDIHQLSARIHALQILKHHICFAGTHRVTLLSVSIRGHRWTPSKALIFKFDVPDATAIKALLRVLVGWIGKEVTETWVLAHKSILKHPISWSCVYNRIRSRVTSWYTLSVFLIWFIAWTVDALVRIIVSSVNGVKSSASRNTDHITANEFIRARLASLNARSVLLEWGFRRTGAPNALELIIYTDKWKLRRASIETVDSLVYVYVIERTVPWIVYWA